MWDDEPRFRLPIDDHLDRARRDENKALDRMHAAFMAHLWDQIEDNIQAIARMDPNALPRLKAALAAIEAGQQ